MTYDWRSLLFIPADNPERQAKAQKTGADAVILDLEDGVAPAAKPAARIDLSAAAQKMKDANIPVVVRVNSGWRELMLDLEVAICPAVQVIMLPKVESPTQVAIISEMISEFEADCGMTVGETHIIALIESPVGLQNLAEIAKIERVAGFALGTEDFCLELGVAPCPDVLDLPARQIAFAAASRKQMALAVPISIAEFRDIEAYSSAANLAANFGATGAICIHPAQVKAANSRFQPDAKTIAQAREILDVWKTTQAQGKAVASLNGMMIDLPVAERAKALLLKIK
ncbi:MAG: CoA ester lyase [Emcibacter sp.]|nr:CoA ester lyase [Emcibacter sp.]